LKLQAGIDRDSQVRGAKQTVPEVSCGICKLHPQKQKGRCRVSAQGNMKANMYLSQVDHWESGRQAGNQARAAK
jgi:hypothetical protein